MPETRSKEDVVRQYDHEVQGGTVVKPFVGFANSGPGDATVLAPLDALRRTTLHNRGTMTGESTSPHLRTNLPLSQSTAPTRGVALSVGANPFYTAIDPYLMAWAAVDEAMRNVVAVGADPDQVSLLDNFSWGNPNLPDRLGGLVRCTQGCYDAAVAFGAPFISGKDSLNNEYTGEDGKKHAIPGTLVISALAMVPDVRRTVTMDLKAAGNLLYLVGLTRGEMGGSSYVRMMRSAGNPLPSPPPTRGRESEGFNSVSALNTMAYDLNPGTEINRDSSLPLVGGGLGEGVGASTARCPSHTLPAPAPSHRQRPRSVLPRLLGGRPGRGGRRDGLGRRAGARPAPGRRAALG